MPKTIYIVTEINKIESSEEVSTAQAFSTKESALEYIDNIINQYETADEIKHPEDSNNWYADDYFDISLFESHLN